MSKPTVQEEGRKVATGSDEEQDSMKRSYGRRDVNLSGQKVTGMPMIEEWMKG
jgi:hypothetical protein